MSSQLTEDFEESQQRFKELIQKVKDWRLREQLRANLDQYTSVLLNGVDGLKKNVLKVTNECALERAERESLREERDELQKEVVQIKLQLHLEKAFHVERQLMEPAQDKENKDLSANVFQPSTLTMGNKHSDELWQRHMRERAEFLAKAERDRVLTPVEKKEKAYFKELDEVQLCYHATKQTFKHNLEKLKEEIAQKENRNRELDLQRGDHEMKQKLKAAKSRVLFLSLKVQELEQLLTRYESAVHTKLSGRWSSELESIPSAPSDSLQLKTYREKNMSKKRKFLRNIQPWNWGKK
ncbi:progesterone-induced-blocking factor 1-like [Cynoglossus semilaevis]|uniref:progesterone-induced-blocking factor 1-like n=1 Tax=Cynoglossus semilaevis TaxID=244447 RepID=UPI0004955CFA|nr:progesterone-induced-blocking factor 1-like [Cynoglossus semilaevis]